MTLIPDNDRIRTLNALKASTSHLTKNATAY